MASRVRSPIASRSHWLTAVMMFRTSRPAAEPVSSDSATDTSATPRRSNRSSSVQTGLSSCASSKANTLCTYGRFLLPLFSRHLVHFPILAHTHKLAVPKVVVRRPFDELELPHELRLEPPTVHHLRGGKTRAPAPGLFLGQIREGAFLDFQWLDLLEQFRSRCGRK